MRAVRPEPAWTPNGRDAEHLLAFKALMLKAAEHPLPLLRRAINLSQASPRRGK